MLRVSFKTIGCRLNQAETARMAAQFRNAGYRIVPFGSPCDVGVVHSCTITAKAEKDSIRAARALKRRAKPPPLVVLAGCAVEAGSESLKQQSGADLLAGQVDKFRLPELLGLHPAATPAAEPTLPLFTTTRAVVKVQDGCDFRCSYCVVPRARGTARSRPASAILDEVRALADAGYLEVVLTGANLGSYRDGTRGLVELLQDVESVPSLARVRLSSVELSTAERLVADHMACSTKLCHYLHLPMQSGDSDVLVAMGRRYTAGEYRDVVNYAAAAVPGVGIGADIIVGFPTETDAAFANTLEAVRDLPFSRLHVFPYSPRPGTRAAAMPDRVSADLKKRRVARLIALGREKRAAFAATFIGKSVSVLVESIGEDGAGTGWTSEYINARVPAPLSHTNSIVEFVPTQATGDVLSSSVCHKAPRDLVSRLEKTGR